MIGVLVWPGAGCGQLLGIEDLPPLVAVDGAPPDAVPLAPVDAAPACTPACVGDELRRCDPERWLVCTYGCDPESLMCRYDWQPSNGARREHLEGVSAGISLSEGSLAVLHTDTGQLLVDGVTVRQPGQGIEDGLGFFEIDENLSLLAVEGVQISLDAQLKALGTRGIVILSAGNVYIEGQIDVSARRCDGSDLPARCGGPGGGDGGTVMEGLEMPATGCAPGGSAGSGGGGGLGSDGAPGGGQRGEGGMSAGCPGPDLVPLRGGSGGGRGGSATAPNNGGGGGGAIQITALTSIVLSRPTGTGLSSILANGGGGVGRNGGGGGGGSGGSILLEAPSIIFRNTVLAANGGGGGGGDEMGNATSGENGLIDPQRAPGGQGQATGGSGGAFEGPATAGGDGTGSGGGGGGSIGVIRLNVPEAGLLIESAILSPMPTRDELPVE